MNILLVNDDGYKAEGINALDEVLTAHGHRVFMVAPETEQSGKSHSMTVMGCVRASEFRKDHYYLTGSPADCIIYPIRSGLISEPIDAVVSGINHGYNASTDITYSGTCGAARQAAIYGIKAIAISADKNPEDGSYDFMPAAGFLAENLSRFLRYIKGDAFLNINIPYGFSGGYELADIGMIDYQDDISLRKEEDGNIIMEVIGMKSARRTFSRKHRADFEVLSSGKASLSFIDIHPHVSYPHMESFDD